MHYCSKDNGSSGSPILNLKNNKVIGIHKEGSFNFNYNKGPLLKYPINDFITKNNNITIGGININKNDINEEYKNNILGEININKEDLNKDIKIINSYEKNEIKENVEIKINEKNIEFTNNYKFQKEGKYKIEYIFKNNLTNTSYLFYNCKSIIDLNLSNFNTKNISNMSHMFCNCNSLTNLNLSNFITKNVTKMNHMFDDCISLINLNLSNFNTE